MERVAEPLPAFASTTSVPAFWMRVVSCSVSSPVNATDGVTCTDMIEAHMRDYMEHMLISFSLKHVFLFRFFFG